MRNKILCALAVLGLLGVGSPAAADEPATSALAEVVVTATRLATPTEAVGSSITLITGSQVERAQRTSLTEILKDVPGVHVAETSGPGSPAGVFIRGAKSEHTLVLIDGVEVNDPGAADRGSSLIVFDTESIERVEVLRGPQSCLYGSDAIGGVINIITETGEGPPRFWVMGEAGSFATFKESVGVRGGTDAVNYSFTANRIDSDGISAAREEDGNTEKDGYHNTSLSGRIGLTPSEEFGLDLFVKYLESESDYDDGGGVGADNPVNVATRENLFVRSQARLDLLDSSWRQKLGVSLATHDRTYDTPAGISEFDSRLVKGDWQNDLHLGDANIVTIAVEIEDEQAETESLDKVSASTLGFFVQDQVDITDSLMVGVAGRLDDHEKFGSEMTYRVAPVYTFGGTCTRLKATYGTGFKAPSLYQLYAPASEWGNIGNENLDPEHSEGWDVGIEQVLLDDKLRLGATYFSNEIKDMIDFENGYVNKSEAEIDGVELLSSLWIADGLSLSASYTYTDARDVSTGDALIRRPKDRATLGVSYEWGKKANVNVSVLYVGRQDDEYFDPTMFSSVDTELSAYTLVNLAASYKIAENTKLFGRVDNLFDEDYEVASGYGMPGVGAYAGVKVIL